MSGQEIGTVVGGIVGAYFGYPQLGMAIGGLIGGAVDPTKVYGPHIGQGQTQTASPGVPIAWVQGTAKVAGTLMVVSPRREVEIGGKGDGTEQITYEARQDFAILICESSELRDSTISGVVMVEQDGKIVYDIRPESKIQAASAKWAESVDFLYGDEDQLPHPTLEMISGVGSTPAYRGRCIAVFKNFNITAAGGRIPQFLFTVSTVTTDATADNVLEDWNVTLETDTGGATNVHDQTNLWYYTKAFSAISANGQPFISDFLVVQANIESGPWGRIGIKLQTYCRADSITTYKNSFDSAAMVETMAIAGALDYDTGWHSEYGPPTPDEIATWFNDHGLNAPITDPNDLVFPAVAITQAPGMYEGIRIHGFEYPGAYDANDYRPEVRLALTGNRPLAPLGSTGYWQDLDDGTLWRPSWLAPASEIIKAPQELNLELIASRICKRGGLTDAQIDVAGLAGVTVAGYAIATQCTGDQALAPLLQAYFAFGTECDAKLLFKFYGEDAIQTVERDDLVITDASNGAISTTQRNQATEFPEKVVAMYIDPAQNYDVNTQTAPRLVSTVVAIGETDIQIPVAMGADQAKQAAEKALKVAYATLEGTRDYSVPFATGNGLYLSLCAGEPVLMDGKRWVVDDMTVSTLSVKLSTRYDRQSAYTSNVQAVIPNPPTTPTSIFSGPTRLLPMNLPSLRPQDTYGVYLAAKGVHDSWRGCTVQVSYDGQATWQNALTITRASIMGVLAEDEATTGATISGGSAVDIGDEDSLSSVTDAQLDANANAYAVVDSDGVAEVRQFQTAALEDDTGSVPGAWLLSDQRTGLLGTTHKDYLADDQFTMLGSVYFLPIDTSFAGKLLFFRAVGFGETASEQVVVQFTYTPDTTVIVDGGTVT